MEQKMIIQGHTISYDNSIVSQGIYYFTREIDDQERKVFFDEAFNYGSAVFADRMGYKYKLVHNGDGYQLMKP